MNAEQINLAIRECLRLCCAGKQPLTTVAAFLAGMKTAGVWSKDEISAVEMGVHRMLHGLLADAVYPRDATNRPFVSMRCDSETTRMNGI